MTIKEFVSLAMGGFGSSSSYSGLLHMEPELKLTFDPIIRITEDAWKAAVEKEEHIRRTWWEIYHEVEGALNKLEALLAEIDPEDLKDYGLYGDKFHSSAEKLKAALRTIGDQGINLGVETNSEREERSRCERSASAGRCCTKRKQQRRRRLRNEARAVRLQVVPGFLPAQRQGAGEPDGRRLGRPEDRREEGALLPSEKGPGHGRPAAGDPHG